VRIARACREMGISPVAVYSMRIALPYTFVLPIKQYTSVLHLLVKATSS